MRSYFYLFLRRTDNEIRTGRTLKNNAVLIQIKAIKIRFGKIQLVQKGRKILDCFRRCVFWNLAALAPKAYLITFLGTDDYPIWKFTFDIHAFKAGKFLLIRFAAHSEGTIKYWIGAKIPFCRLVCFRLRRECRRSARGYCRKSRYSLFGRMKYRKICRKTGLKTPIRGKNTKTPSVCKLFLIFYICGLCCNYMLPFFLKSSEFPSYPFKKMRKPIFQRQRIILCGQIFHPVPAESHFEQTQAIPRVPF